MYEDTKWTCFNSQHTLLPINCEIDLISSSLNAVPLIVDYQIRAALRSSLFVSHIYEFVIFFAGILIIISHKQQ